MQNKLPADPSALILGIVGLVIGIAGCCCYGFTAVIPLALSIVGLVMANKSLKLYKTNPSEFTESSRSNVSIARVINIISIILNAIFLLFVVGAIAFIGIAGLQGAFDKMKDDAYGEKNIWEYEDDFTQGDDRYDENTIEIDSMHSDSIFLEEVYPETDSLY